MSIPAIAAFATLQFLWVWNDLLIAKLFLKSENTTVIVKLQQLLGTQGQGAGAAHRGSLHLDHRPDDRLRGPAALHGPWHDLGRGQGLTPPHRPRHLHAVPSQPFTRLGGDCRMPRGSAAHALQRTSPPDRKEHVVADFAYEDLLPIGADETPYRLLTTEGVRAVEGPEDARSSRSTPRRCGCSPRPRCTTSPTTCGPGTSSSCATSSRTPRRATTTSSSPSTCSRTPTSLPAACCPCARTPARRSSWASAVSTC